MIGDFSLTRNPCRVYSSPIAAQVAIWFRSQEDKRVAASSGIFTPVYMTSLSFFGRVVWGALRSPVLIPGLRTHSTRPPYQLMGAGFITVLGDRHDK